MSIQSIIAPVIFKDIPEFPGYRVGDDGSVWSRWVLKGGRGNRRRHLDETWKRLKTPLKSGYPRVTLVGQERERFDALVHILVLTAFVGPRPHPSAQCLHSNDVPTDNRLCNLRWGTPAENWEDSRKNGRRTVGEQVHNAKTTADMVLRIREALTNGETLKSVASWCGLSWQQVYAIKARKVWRHV
jgi:hypothetical protein